MLRFYPTFRARLQALAPVALPELLAHMPDGLVMLNQRGVVTAYNDAASALLATPQREWNGRIFLDMIVGSPLEVDLRALLAPPVAATRHLIYEGADGVRAVELQLSPLYAGGKQTGALLAVRERTDRAQLERSRDRRAVEVSVLKRLVHVTISALKTDELLRAIIRELAQALPGTRVAIGLLQPDRVTLSLMVDESLDAAPTLEGQPATENDLSVLLNLVRDGQTRTIDITDRVLGETAAQAMLQRAGLRRMLVVPLFSQASLLGVMFVDHARQRMVAPSEAQLFVSVGELIGLALGHTQHVEQVEAASRTTAMIHAKVSHEFRSPLSSIIGFIDLVEQGAFGELPEQMQEPMALMRYSSTVLLRLANDILDFSKIEAGNLAIELGPVDLALVIQTVVGTLQPQIRAGGLAVSVVIAPDLPHVHGNSARLAQVLTNLLANAIKFTEHGSITVRAVDNGESVRFSVEDTGIGIAPKQQGLLFQEFHQLKNEHMRHYAGSGLGLAISRQLMQLMGGTLVVESTPSVGSIFYGELPIVSKSLREKEQGGA
jgi:signal transduction histidine kinase